MTLYTGKTAIVTGAASGIGRSLGIALARRGANVRFSKQTPVGIKYSDMGSISQEMFFQVIFEDFTACWTIRINSLPMLFDFRRLNRKAYSSR